MQTSAAAIEDVTIAQWTWKTEAMRQMVRNICALALDRGRYGTFSALNLDEHGAAQHGGVGIAGSVFRALATLEVIAPDGVVVDGEFVQRYTHNAQGNRIGIWRLASSARAQALLDRLGAPAPVFTRQEEFELQSAGLTEQQT